MNGLLAPPELRILIGLFAELAGLLPIPSDPAGWERHDRVKLERESLLGSRLQLLNDVLAEGQLWPDVAEKSLTEFCQRSIKQIRAQLAEPLGYEPAAKVPAAAVRELSVTNE